MRSLSAIPLSTNSRTRQNLKLRLHHQLLIKTMVWLCQSFEIIWLLKEEIFIEKLNIGLLLAIAPFRR